MIRPATLLLLAVAGLAGAALFHVSYDVSALEERLRGLNREIVADQEAIHVLRAEWSFLNQPARLEELSQRYLDLQPMTGRQIADASALPVRLPTPDATGDDSESGTAIAALEDDTGAETVGPQPLIKPQPPAAMRATPVRAATPARSTPPRSAAEPAAAAIPVAARSLDDVLADLAAGGTR